MPLDLIDVIRIAREFAELAGWGYFKVNNIRWDEEKKAWILSAFLGAFSDKLMKFTIDDTGGNVIAYTSKKEE